MPEAYIRVLKRAAFRGFRVFATTGISPSVVDNFKFSYYISVYVPVRNSDGYRLEGGAVKVWHDKPL